VVKKATAAYHTIADPTIDQNSGLSVMSSQQKAHLAMQQTILHTTDPAQYAGTMALQPGSSDLVV